MIKYQASVFTPYIWYNTAIGKRLIWRNALFQEQVLGEAE